MKYKPANKRVVYVGRFNYTTTKKYLIKLFSKFGSVKRIWKSFEYPTQYAFIHFKDKSSAFNAIKKFDGKKIKGYSVKVNTPREYFPDCTLRNNFSTYQNSNPNKQCLQNNIRINNENKNESNQITEITLFESDIEENDIIELRDCLNDDITFVKNNNSNSRVKLRTLTKSRSQLELNLDNKLSNKRPILIILDSPSKSSPSKKICIRNDESLSQSYQTITID